MKKLSTLFKKDPNDLGRVINEIDPKNQWVLDGDGLPTRKYDGTAVCVMNDNYYKRYDVKHGKKVPEGAIPCQEPDEITGHWPHWVEVDDNNPADKYIIEAFSNTLFSKVTPIYNGTYEAIGEKINGNREKVKGHLIVRHGAYILQGLVFPYTFESIKQYLESVDIEGIVFHHKTDGRMCKIRKSDFGIKRI